MKLTVVEGAFGENYVSLPWGTGTQAPSPIGISYSKQLRPLQIPLRYRKTPPLLSAEQRTDKIKSFLVSLRNRVSIALPYVLDVQAGGVHEESEVSQEAILREQYKHALIQLSEYPFDFIPKFDIGGVSSVTHSTHENALFVVEGHSWDHNGHGRFKIWKSPIQSATFSVFPRTQTFEVPDTPDLVCENDGVHGEEAFMENLQ